MLSILPKWVKPPLNQLPARRGRHRDATRCSYDAGRMMLSEAATTQHLNDHDQSYDRTIG